MANSRFIFITALKALTVFDSAIYLLWFMVASDLDSKCKVLSTPIPFTKLIC